MLVGGVNSPVRSFQAVGGTPLYFNRAEGAHLFDLDGNRYIDYCQSWGALILGHAAKPVTRAIRRQALKGTSFGAPTLGETELAKLLRDLFPSCEQFRFMNSGTEAVMTAIRLARGITGKTRVIKFEGAYHGHVDSLLVKAGSGLSLEARATSAGIPPSFARTTTVLPYNEDAPLEKTFRRFKDIACVIVEPVAGNMGVVPGSRKFLKTLKNLTQRHGALLIFDEVITGFRVGLDGEKRHFGVVPDLTTLGKVIGGGLPIGALGGPRRWMSYLAPDGPVYQAGTLSGNPLSISAGIETVRMIKSKAFLERLHRRSQGLMQGMKKAFNQAGVSCSIVSTGSMFSIFFMERPPRNFQEISKDHPAMYRSFFRHMLSHGVYFPPSAYEAMFVSQAHSESDFAWTLKAIASFRP